MAEPFLGEIRMFAGNFAPRDYSLCDGSLININQNPSLYALLGTAYGGNGTTTFGIPDLRGRVPVGIGHTNYRGQSYGVEQVTLSNHNLPAHSHQVNKNFQGTIKASTDQANITTPSVNTRFGKGFASGFSEPLENYKNGGSTPDVQLAGTEISGEVAIANAGSSIAHNNMQPYLAINYIISMHGVFPPRP